MPAAVYSVTLRHLSADATKVSITYPDEQFLAVNIDQLRTLLYAFGMVSSELSIYEPAAPEIRVKTERDVFVIRTRYRRLYLVGWETILRGQDHTVAYLLTAITGTEEQVKASPKAERTTSRPGSSASNPPIEKEAFPRWAKIAAMIALIIVFNGITAWMWLKPGPSLVPKNTPLGPTESNTLLLRTVGLYETGRTEGHRRMVIAADGTLKLSKYGPQEAVLQERLKAARGALVEGRPALLTSDPGVITIKDADTLVYFNSTYKRRQP